MFITRNTLNRLTFIFSILILTSCSGDDDGSTGNNTIEPLIGNWEYVTQFENENQITANDCNPSTINFTDSGNRIDLYYDTNSAGDCIVVDTVNLTWEKLSNGTYQFTQNGFSFSDIVTFEDENNSLTLESSDTDGNGVLVVYQFKYTRID